MESERPGLAKLKRILDDKLDMFGLDWRSRVENLLRFSWSHGGGISRADIDAWLKQFSDLGSHGWIGERLLRALNFWPAPRLLQALDLTVASIAGFGHICVNTQTIGKSAGVVSNQVQKHLETLGAHVKTVDDLWNVLEKDNKSVLYIEDCLLSGTETCSLLRGLLNETTEGRRPKVSALADPERLRSRRIEMRFGVIANLGRVVVEEFVSRRRLANISVAQCGMKLATLTEDGVLAVRNGEFIDETKCMRDPAKHVRPMVFSDLALWDHADRLLRAKQFCQTLGTQLWQGYVDSKGWRWDKRRVEQCGLGMNGQGLALAFAHSVPKSSLPLFWYGGKVKLGSVRLTWRPLFPNAT
ncbi:MAG TPA: hypothetical protein VN380_07135 [Thermoanaerobaculia bacterium]|nr:hypothetical protein [Thermoanaerobaculia bacterium]